MKLMIDGTYYTKTKELFDTLQQYMKRAVLIDNSELCNTIYSLKGCNEHERESFYRNALNVVSSGFNQSVPPLTDTIQYRSFLISAYMFEKMESWLNPKVKPLTDLLYKMLVSNYGSDICFSVYYNRPQDLQYVDDKSGYFGDPYYQDNPDYIRKFHESYEKLLNKFIKDPNCNFYLKNTILDASFLLFKLDAQAQRVNLKYPDTLILDIDDVLVNYQGDLKNNALITRSQFNDKDFVADCMSYIEDGFIMDNLFYFLDDYFKIMPKVDKVNLVILTARAKGTEHNFLMVFSHLLEKYLAQYVKNTGKTIDYNKETNLLANVTYSNLNGATFFKSYAVNYIFSSIVDKYGSKKNSLVYYDDREKYINAAYDSVKFLNSKVCNPRDLNKRIIELQHKIRPEGLGYYRLVNRG